MEGEVSEFWNPKECTLPIVQKRWMVGTKKDVPTACVGMLFGPNDAETNGFMSFRSCVMIMCHVPCADTTVVLRTVTLSGVHVVGSEPQKG